MILWGRALLVILCWGCTATTIKADERPGLSAGNAPPPPSPQASQTSAPQQNTDNSSRNALTELIHKVSSNKIVDSQSDSPTDTKPAALHAPKNNFATSQTPVFTDVTVPVAKELWQISDKACLSLLKQANIQTHTPDFPTPFVRSPLILDSPIEGVTIDTRWPKDPYRRVMDCRLIATLIKLARAAKVQKVKKIQYYSSWRPIKPLEKCPKGKKGNKCRKVYNRAKNGHVPSQHSRATAIDIRWFTFENDEEIDVLTHYEKHFHQPPCQDNPKTDAGKFLKNFACDLHEQKAFNVMLTPNADRDHANHFHFDITPNVGWYIIR